MKKKLPIILIALVVIVAVGIFVACSGSEDSTAETPPAQSSAPSEPVTPEVKPDPVPETVSPEPSVEPTPVEPEKTGPSPEPEKEPEKEPVVTPTPEVTETPEPFKEPEPVVTPEPTPTTEPTPVPDETQRPTGPDESNKQEEQARQEAQQSASSKFTYPPNSTTEGLNSFYVSNGCYIDKSTGKIYDQEGNCYGTANGYGSSHTATQEEEDQAIKNTEENANKIYNGDGSGSDTSGWGN